MDERTSDEIDAEIMEDFARLRSQGHGLITLVINDVMAHEEHCDFVMEERYTSRQSKGRP